MTPSGRKEPNFTQPSAVDQTGTTDGGLRLLPLTQLLEPHSGTIARIKLAAGVPGEAFERLYLGAILGFASYVQTLPATRHKHHFDTGGMLAYGLETGFLSLQMADNKIFSGQEAVERRSSTETCWRLAAFLAGLLGDLGTLTRMSVYAANGNQWEPIIEPLTSFANTNNAESEKVFLYWPAKSEAEEHEHHLYSSLILPRVLNRNQLEYLLDGGRHILRALTMAVSGQTSATLPNTLLTLIGDAKNASIDKDMRSRGSITARKNTSMPLEHFLIDALRRLAKTRWRNSEPDGLLWVSKVGVFIHWFPAASQVVTLLQADELAVPRDADTLAEILTQHDVLIRSPNAGRRESLYWNCVHPKTGETVSCVRVHPEMLHLDQDMRCIELQVNPVPSENTIPAVLQPLPTNILRPGGTNTDANNQKGETHDLFTDDAQAHGGAPTVNENTNTGAENILKQEHQTIDIEYPVRNYQAEGMAGAALQALAEDVRAGKRRLHHDVLPVEGGVAIRFPDALKGYGCDTAQILQMMAQRGWLVRNQTNKKSYLHEVTDKYGASLKSILLEPQTSADFLNMAGGVPEKTEFDVRATQKTTPKQILDALTTASKNGVLEPQLRMNKAGTAVICPYPDTFTVLARILGRSFNDISMPILRGDILLKDGGRPVRTEGDKQTIHIKIQYVPELSEHCQKSTPKEEVS